MNIYHFSFTNYNFFMQPRTKRQREVLEYITAFIIERGYEPSYQQIARHFRIASKSAIAKHITALENQGLLSRQRENGSFGLRVRPAESLASSVSEIRWLEIPFKDGLPEEFELEALFVPKFLLNGFPPEQVRAFRIRDEAMIEDHICEGDIILVEKRFYARDGDVVVVLIENKRIAVKKYYRSGANIELQSANPSFLPINLPADKVAVQGVYRGLLRLVS